MFFQTTQFVVVCYSSRRKRMYLGKIYPSLLSGPCPRTTKSGGGGGPGFQTSVKPPWQAAKLRASEATVGSIKTWGTNCPTCYREEERNAEDTVKNNALAIH